MANILSDQFAYVLADITGMMLETVNGGLRGKGTVTVIIADMPVKFSPEVVSSFQNKTCAMLLVRLSGNLVMLASAIDRPSGHKIDARVSLLNAAKMDRISGRLELMKYRTHEAAVKDLGVAVMASYVKIAQNEWATA